MCSIKRFPSPKFRTLLPGFDADYAPVECRDGQLYYVTNRDASNYALMKVDLNDPSKVSTVIPESGGKLLEGVGSAGGYLFATYLEHAQSKVCQYGFDGKLVREIELPAIGTGERFRRREGRYGALLFADQLHRAPPRSTNTTSPAAHRRSI